MSRFRFKIISVSLIVLFLLPLFLSCESSTDIVHQIAGDAAPYRFNIFTWEVKTLAKELVEPLVPGHKDAAYSEEKTIESRVREAFSNRGFIIPPGIF